MNSSNSGDLPLRIYSPEPALKHPAVMAREMIADVWAGRELAWRLFVRDVSAQYRQTFLGYIWAFLPPLVGSATFIFLNSQGIVKIEGTGMPYAAFATIGTLLWQTFVDAFQSPTQALLQAKPMLAKINFPREAILVSGIYMIVFNFLIRMALVIAVMFWWGLVPGITLLLFPVAVAALIVCGLAIGLAIAPIGGLYGDVGKGLPIIAQFFMLLTPVIYPAGTSGLAGVLAIWNPVSPLLLTARESLTGQSVSMLPQFCVVLAVASAVLLGGWVGFKVAMPHLIARMGG